ncbi:MAG: T9SS type A sorting domain-containing protein [Bacteroidota bacterium]|nr:T9SS type A sorting domain-containing protein [Bacteroidota bacterium]MDP3147032.1 T9SS type A sorting domain-containing protein [Bacteroidota bacterium]
MKNLLFFSAMLISSLTSLQAQLKPTINPIVNANFNYISSSENIYTSLYSSSSPLQYNDNLNVVSFIHRKSPTYISFPNSNSGSIVAMIGKNFGTLWDSTCVWTNSTQLGRYPQGGIYNPMGNTNFNNSYIVSTGPSFGPSGWDGNFYASKSLSGAGTNTPGIDQQYLSDMLSSYPATQAKHSLSRNSFVATDDGKVRSVAGIYADVNASNSGPRGVMLVTGVFNAGAMVWKTDSFVPNTVVDWSGTKYINTSGYQAWNESGTVGYVVMLGVLANATGSNRAPQPIIYKTTNSGTSWAQVNSINFNSPICNGVKASLSSVNNNSVLTKPFYRDNEGMSCVVDINNKLHIIGTVSSSYSDHNDSLYYAQQFTLENYNWPMTNFYYPYIYDFFGDGTTTWNGNIIDSVGTQAPGYLLSSPGYNNNPWDADGNGNKVASSMRIQAGRSPSGQHILYSWAESDTNNTTNNACFNELPNIKLRAWDAVSNEVSEEIDITAPCSNPRIPNNAFFHYIAPTVIANSIPSVVTFSVPVTVSNSFPLSQLTKNDHFYSTAVVDFTNYQPSPLRLGNITSTTKSGLKINEKLNVFPNPATNTVVISFKSKEIITTNISIYDLNEKLIKSINVNSNDNLTVNIEELTAGVYLLKITTSNSTYVKKLIKE